MDYPKKPVDGFVLRWWEVSCEGRYVTEHTATYHSRTLASDYFHDGIGADLVEDWMIAKDGSDMGRCWGWNAMRDRGGYWTRETAVSAAIQRIDQRLEFLREEIDDCTEMRRQWIS